MSDSRLAMWVHGVSAYPERTDGDIGADAPLMQVEHVPWSNIVGLRQGFGAKFRGKADHTNWFQFAIPTPVLVPIFHPDSGRYDTPFGQRLRIDKVFVLHLAESGNDAHGVFAKAWLTDVHVWDGAETRYVSMPWPRDDIAVGVGSSDRQVGDDGQHHLSIQDGANAWPLAGAVVGTAAAPVTPAVHWGVCISVNVRFGQDADISFAAAGVDFLVDVP